MTSSSSLKKKITIIRDRQLVELSRRCLCYIQRRNIIFARFLKLLNDTSEILSVCMQDLLFISVFVYCMLIQQLFVLVMVVSSLSEDAFVYYPLHSKIFGLQSLVVFDIFTEAPSNRRIINGKFGKFIKVEHNILKSSEQFSFVEVSKHKDDVTISGPKIKFILKFVFLLRLLFVAHHLFPSYHITLFPSVHDFHW